MSDRKHVVYTMDEDNKPARFLDVVSHNKVNETMNKWWKAFENGEKAKPENYNGISHQPVADFERWKAPKDE